MSSVVSTTSTINKPPVDQQTVARQRQRRAMTKLGESVVARVILIATCVLFLVPFYWMFVTALKPDAELSIFPPELWPRAVQWGNFLAAVNTFPFWTYFGNTLVITAGVIIGSIISNLFVAYGFACIRWPGRDLVFYIVLATVFIPLPVALIPLFDMFAYLHWTNTFLPLIVPAFFSSSFYVFMLRQFLLQIPSDLLDAARIDGASELQILWRIIFPLARPALAIVAILSGIAAWNDFTGPLIYLQDDTLRTLSVGLETFRTVNSQDVQVNLLMAASLLVIVPTVILFLFCQRFFVRGAILGSIK
ncbi:MAG TPA: carbohydrate ABC transporter permease [Ktedonosporobacter sp.]|nr:carbohydrate ABC transporter permease [Ktedonosporobacter sp.]